MIVVDALTKYIEVKIVNSTSTKDTIDALSMIFARNGLCDTLVSDNAACFTPYEFASFLAKNLIKHLTPPPFSSASNGQAERGVSVLKNMFKKSPSDCSFKRRLSKVLLQYRTLPHSSTHVSPSVGLNKRKLITLKDKINPQFCTVDDDHCIKTKLPHFEIGSSVLALNLGRGQK